MKRAQGFRAACLGGLLLGIATCAFSDQLEDRGSEEAYERAVKSWIGSTELEVAKAWGPPVRSYEVQGLKFLTYIYRENVHVPGTAARTYQPATYYSATGLRPPRIPITVAGREAQDVEFVCETTMEFQDGKLRQAILKGNDCRK